MNERALAVLSMLALSACGGPRDGHRYSPLVYASRAGHPEVVRALLEAGAAPDARDHGPNGWTALQHAIHKGQDATAAVLVEGGADVNAASRGGITPLFMAAEYGNTHMVRLLLAHGADPRAETSDGVNALWAALGGGAVADITDGPGLGTCFPDTAKALLERAPDLTVAPGLETRVLTFLARGSCGRLLAQLTRKS